MKCRWFGEFIILIMVFLKHFNFDVNFINDLGKYVVVLFLLLDTFFFSFFLSKSLLNYKIWLKAFGVRLFCAVIDTFLKYQIYDIVTHTVNYSELILTGLIYLSISIVIVIFIAFNKVLFVPEFNDKRVYIVSLITISSSYVLSSLLMLMVIKTLYQ